MQSPKLLVETFPRPGARYTNDEKQAILDYLMPKYRQLCHAFGVNPVPVEFTRSTRGYAQARCRRRSNGSIEMYCQKIALSEYIRGSGFAPLHALLHEFAHQLNFIYDQERKHGPKFVQRLLQVIGYYYHMQYNAYPWRAEYKRIRNYWQKIKHNYGG